MCNTVGYEHTVRLAWTIECTMGNGTPQCLMEMGRGGAYVPARVAPSRAHPSFIPARTMRVFFLYGNAAAQTFGRAHRHRPYAFCLRELRADVRPYGFVWADCTWVVDVVWVDCVQMVILFVWDCVEKYDGDW